MIDFTEFTKNDWMGLAGCEPFEDGSEPRIANIVLDGAEATVVHDRNGIGIVMADGENEVHLPSIFADEDEGLTEDEIKDALFGLTAEMTSVALQALGFRTPGGAPFTAATAAAVYAPELDFAPGARIDEDEDAPMRFAVWLDDDIIGAGDTKDEAINDARATVRGWSKK